MRRRIIAKWRPPLWMVLGGTLGTVLCLPLIGIVSVRYLWQIVGYQEALIIAGCGVLAATTVLGWMLWRVLYRPMTLLAYRAHGIRRGEGDALDPLPHYGTSELKELGQAMLEMGRVLRGREAVLRSYADHATHELKSPLTVLRGAAELLSSPDLSDAERSRLLGRIDEAADRMTGLLDAQRALAAAQEPGMGGSCSLKPLLPELQLEHSTVEIALAHDAVLPMGRDGLRMVLDHLIGNAAANGASEVVLTAREGMLRVRDNGPGVSAGNRDRIFDPFFTTRREAGGTGMGLPIVQRLLQAQGAEISLLDGSPGAVFEVLF